MQTPVKSNLTKQSFRRDGIHAVRNKLQFILISLILAITSPIFAQNNPPPIITANNITQLMSVAQVDYDNPTRVLTGEINEIHEVYWKPPFETGWFALSDDANLVFLPTNEALYFMRLLDQPLFSTFSGFRADSSSSLIDVYSGSLMSAWGYRTQESYVVQMDDLLYGGQAAILEIDSENLPVGIWTECADDNSRNCHVWLEIQTIDSNEPAFVVKLPSISEMGGRTFTNLQEEQLETIPYAPAQDPDASVRIGRIPPPYVVTSSVDGEVKLWNIQTGEVLASQQIADGPAVFGNINAAATHLAWRNPQSELLHVLDFETGEDISVDELGGDYAQYFFLTNNADVIIAVNIEFEPIVVAWNIESGERFNLGEYRHCNRIPDMVRLSQDGTSLVIGCDTGLDIWRVVE